MPLKYEKRTILQFDDNEFVYAVLEHSGNKYDFYYQIITKLVGNKYRTYVHVVITYSNEKKIIAWYRRRGSLNDTVENANALFKNTINKCQRLENLNDKSNKELKETDYNLHEIVDDCDLTVKP